MNFKDYRFSVSKDKEFSSVLRKRVNAYFNDAGISRNANDEMKLKSLLTVSVYLISFTSILLLPSASPIVLFTLFIVMGISKALIGTCVMHDALHGSYSKNARTNKLIGYVSYLIGVNALNWKLQHNVKHHSFTNVEDVDEDLDPRFFMRFAPNQPMRWFHRYQHFYATFLYCFTAIMWVSVKDPHKMYMYNKEGLIKEGKESRVELTKMVVHKLIYYMIVIGLPILLLDQPVWLTIVMLLTMYAVTGFILSSTFQLAHVMPDNEYVAPKETNIKDNRFVHQLKTTSNFGTNCKFTTWFTGGLNFQIEHHLFPNICHVHYPQISKIVENTSREFGIPYKQHGSYIEAYGKHLAVLKALGK